MGHRVLGLLMQIPVDLDVNSAQPQSPTAQTSRTRVTARSKFEVFFVICHFLANGASYEKGFNMKVV